MSMSQGDLKELLRSLIHEEFQKLDKIKNLEMNQQTHAQHVFDCPDCYKDIVNGMRASEFFCEDCGLPLGSEDLAKKLGDCPRCHGTKAKRKE